MAEVIAKPATRPTVSGAASRLMIDAVVAEATAMSVPVTVAVVDESGVIKEMLRMDGAPLVSVQTAINKAYAAAAIGMPPRRGRDRQGHRLMCRSVPRLGGTRGNAGVRR